MVNPNPYASSLASGLNALSDKARAHAALEPAINLMQQGRPSRDIADELFGSVKPTPAPKPASPRTSYIRDDVPNSGFRPKRPMSPAQLADAGIPVTAVGRDGTQKPYRLHPEAYAELVRRGEIKFNP